jgi:hypothetical protein
MNLRVWTIAFFSVTISATLCAQQRPSALPETTGAVTPVPTSSRSATGPRPYSEVITSKAKTSRGLFLIHRIEDKYFFEISDSMMNREILVVNRISKAPSGGRAGFLGYAGDQIADNVISFEKGPNNRVFLRSISYQEMSRDSSQGHVYVGTQF